MMMMMMVGAFAEVMKVTTYTGMCDASSLDTVWTASVMCYKSKVKLVSLVEGDPKAPF